MLETMSFIGSVVRGYLNLYEFDVLYWLQGVFLGWESWFDLPSTFLLLLILHDLRLWLPLICLLFVLVLYLLDAWVVFGHRFLWLIIAYLAGFRLLLIMHLIFRDNILILKLLFFGMGLLLFEFLIRSLLPPDLFGRGWSVPFDWGFSHFRVRLNKVF